MTVCKHTVSRSISLPSSGFFSSFPHGTCPLSVSKEYLALESGLPRFRQGFTCLVLLRILSRSQTFQIQGFHLLWPTFPNRSPIPQFIIQVLQPQKLKLLVWATPLSLAATSRISLDYFSCWYLDVSVPNVRFSRATLLTLGYLLFPISGFPHSEITGSMPA